MILLEEVGFGPFYFETAVLLREAIFVNGILFNIEVSYGLTQEDINRLEMLDNLLMKKIMSAHSKSPTETLFLSLGCIPLKWIIVSRRINFLHYVLKRKEGDLLRSFFEVQWKYPVKNDWVNTVKQDLLTLNINPDLEEIRNKSKYSFSKIVKEKVKDAAFSELLGKKEGHSKTKNLKYEKLEMQSYFKNKNVFKKDAKVIYKFQTYMATGVKMNFKSQFTEDLKCPECKSDNVISDTSTIPDDTQEHLLQHSEIAKTQSVEEFYMKLFVGTDREKLEVAKLLQKCIDSRTKS